MGQMGRFWRYIYKFLGQCDTHTPSGAPISSSDLKLVGHRPPRGRARSKTVKTRPKWARWADFGDLFIDFWPHRAPSSQCDTYPPGHPYLPTTSDSWPKRPPGGRARSKTVKSRPKWARWADFGDIFIGFWPQGPRQANVTPTYPPGHPYLPTTSDSWPKRPPRGRARSKKQSK